MKETLITLLETFGYPVFLQGSLSVDSEYPESFFTFWNNDSYDGSHYDNDAINYIWSFDVNFYSVDPSLVNSMLMQAKKLLKQNKFIITGRGYDVLSDEPSHTGRGMNVLFSQLVTDLTTVLGNFDFPFSVGSNGATTMGTISDEETDNAVELSVIKERY